MEKFMLSEEGYVYLTKGIAIGVGIGIFVGAFLENIILTFAAGGVIGMIGGLIYSAYKSFKKKKII